VWEDFETEDLEAYDARTFRDCGASRSVTRSVSHGFPNADFVGQQKSSEHSKQKRQARNFGKESNSMSSVSRSMPPQIEHGLPPTFFAGRLKNSKHCAGLLKNSKHIQHKKQAWKIEEEPVYLSLTKRRQTMQRSKLEKQNDLLLKSVSALAGADRGSLGTRRGGEHTQRSSSRENRKAVREQRY
jgi:hypothetical protein